MTTRYIDDLSQCEHLLVVEGAPSAIAAFVEKARIGELPLSLRALLPPPANLAEVDPVMLAHFHLVFGEFAEAQAIYDEINEPWPLPDCDPDSSALRDLLRTDPSITANARKVQRNVSTYGELDAASWRRSRWGTAKDLADVAFEDVSDERVHYRFTDAVNRLEALRTIAQNHPELDVGAVAADFTQRKQGWFYRFANADTMQGEAKAFPEGEPVVELFIDNLPETFAYAG